MYFVKYGKNYLHDPRTDDYILLDLTLDCEENSCGYCDFTIYPNHPMYGKLRERDADNPIEVYDGDILLFAGFIYNLGEEFYLDGHVKCKGELDYLKESIIRPYSTIQRGFGNKAPDTVNGYFKWIITQHNTQVSANKQFAVGKNWTGPTNKIGIYKENDDYPTTIDEISEALLHNEKIGGYLRVRHENGVRYIDYIYEWSDTNTQILDFGVNLTGWTKEDDSEEIATYVVPLGANMSNTEYEYDDGYSLTEDKTMVEGKEYFTHPFQKSEKIAEFVEGVIYYEEYTDTFVTSDTSPIKGIDYYTKDGDNYSKADISRFVEGVTYYEQEKYYVETKDTIPSDDKDYYYIDWGSYSSTGDLGRFKKHETYYEYNEEEDESDLHLTIEGLTDTRYDTDYVKSGDKIYCVSAVNKYGWIGMKYEDSELTAKADLALAGLIALKEKTSPKRTIEIKAVDMHLVNPDIKPIRIGEYVRVRSAPHKLDSYFLCSSIDLDLNNPENSIYTLRTTYDTFTGQKNAKINMLNSTINKDIERV